MRCTTARAHAVCGDLACSDATGLYGPTLSYATAMTNEGSGTVATQHSIEGGEVAEKPLAAPLEPDAEPVPTRTCHLGSLRAFTCRITYASKTGPGLSQALLSRGILHAARPNAWRSVGRGVGCAAEKSKKRHRILATVKAC